MFEFSIEAGKLSAAMKKVSAIVEARNTIPILSNVMIEAVPRGAEEAGFIKITATDLDMEATVKVPADVVREGVTTVSASIVEQYLSKLPKNAAVDFGAEPRSQHLIMRSGRSSAKLLVLPAEDFPEIQAREYETTFTVGGTALRTLLEAVRYAISSEETRYYLGGIYLHRNENADRQRSLSACATDGHRLSLAHIPMPDLVDFAGVILPKKTVAIALRLIPETEDVQISLTAAQIRLDCGPVVLVSKLIDGTFPDYQRVIPRSSNAVAVLPRKSLATVVDRVATICSEKGRAMKFDLEPGKLNVSMRSVDAGSEAEEDMEIRYEAEKISFGMNARYLADTLNSFGDVEGADELQFAVVDPGAPVVVRRHGHPNRLAVIMPMRA